MKLYLNNEKEPMVDEMYSSITIEIGNGDRFTFLPGKHEILVTARNTKALLVRPAGGANSVRLKTERL